MKLKKGQQIWYLSYWNRTISKGVLKDLNNVSDFGDLQSLYVEGEHGRVRVLSNWIFGTEKKAKIYLKKIILQDIEKKEREIEYLKRRISNDLSIL